MRGALGNSIGGLAAGLLVFAALSASALAQSADPARGTGVETIPPAPGRDAGLISADEIVYDEDLAIVTARGKVEISQDDRVLMADTVSYNQRSDVVTASGNVVLIEPDGEVIYAEFAELTGDLREGFIRDIGIMLKDNNRIAGASALRTGGNLTVVRNGVYSPCNLCRENPDEAPFWQLKATKVIHDQEEQTVRYSNAWLEMGGLPVLYLPYFEHPDPTVDRKSGFLTPTLGRSSQLGTVVQIPYYWTLGDTADITFEPIFTTDQSAVAAGEYRQLFKFGRHEFRGSATVADREANNGETKRNEFRGHIEAEGLYELNEAWRSGFDLNRTTDDTYLRLYGFSDAGFLTSRVFTEYFDGRDHGEIEAIAFQGLREEDVDEEEPIVAPLIDYSYKSEPLFGDGVLRLDPNLAILTRVEGRDTQRASLVSEFEMPFTDPIGGAYTFTARLQTDGYWTQDFEPGNDDVNPTGVDDSEVAGRFFPQAALNWRLPMVRHSEFLDQLIQPSFQFVAGPDFGNPAEIPNEDSLDFEFDDTNLFSLNRFPGRDRVDEGQRIDYGFLWEGTTPDDRGAEVFVGQSYRLREQEDLFTEQSGVRDNLSDIVGRVRIQPIAELDLLYRFRLDKDDYAARRHEIDVNVGPPALNFQIGYLFTDEEASTDTEIFDKREEIKFNISSRLTEELSTSFFLRRDLDEDENLRASVGLVYQNECFTFELVGERNFFNDREIDSEDTVFFRVEFKNLGSFSPL